MYEKEKERENTWIYLQDETNVPKERLSMLERTLTLLSSPDIVVLTFSLRKNTLV